MENIIPKLKFFASFFQKRSGVWGMREAIESGQAGFAPWLQEGLERIGALAGIGGNYSMPTA